jgi:hypothetical protein
MMSGLIDDVRSNEVNTLRGIGEALQTVASLPAGDFHCHLRHVRALFAQRKILHLEDRLASGLRDSFGYSRDALAYIQGLQNGNYRENAGIPSELLYGSSVHQALLITKSIVLLYAKLLLNWTDLVAAGQSWSARAD